MEMSGDWSKLAMCEEVEKAVRRQQYYKEQAASVQEMENGRKEGEKLDKLLQELGKQYTRAS